MTKMDKDWEEYQYGLQGTNTGSNMNRQGLHDSNNTCFPADCQVLTPNGWRRIADIEPGEFVMTRKSSGRLQPRRVLARKDYAPCRIAAVLGDQGQELFRVTRSHTVLTTRGWCMVDRLHAGDRLVSIDPTGSQTVHEVGAVVDSGAIEPVHNLIVAGSYTFVARGCVSHSFTYFRALRMALSELRSCVTGVGGAMPETSRQAGCEGR